MQKIAKYFDFFNGYIKCTLCPNECLLKDNSSGLCLVRKRVGDKLFSLSYGQGVGFAMDPVEKKPLYHFFPSSKVLSFGTFGCNLHCMFCQNDFLSHPLKLEEVKYTSPEEIVFFAKDNDISLIAFTYNEPTVFIEYLVDIAKACKKYGIKTVAVSAGYINKEPREDFYKYIDAVNIDLKSFNKKFYKNFCKIKFEKVLETILYVAKKKDTWLELTNLIIPNENDSLEEIKKMIAWILNNLGDNVPLHFSAFYPAYKMQDKPTTNVNTLNMARSLAIDMGLKYVYIGNVFSKDSQTTYCPQCKEPLIIRDGLRVIENKLLISKGLCPKCKTACDGVFI